jgi:hypothetical protein
MNRERRDGFWDRAGAANEGMAFMQFGDRLERSMAEVVCCRTLPSFGPGLDRNPRARTKFEVFSFKADEPPGPFLETEILKPASHLKLQT